MEIVRNNDIQLNFDSDGTFNYVKQLFCPRASNVVNLARAIIVFVSKLIWYLTCEISHR